MEMKKITAIVPAYNEEKTVANVVEAIKGAQSVEEVLVVSDGSTDDTAQEARRAGARVIELRENRGKGQAMLQGVARARTEIIAFFDADLIGLSSKHVETLVRSVLSGRKMMNVGLRNRGRVLNVVARHMPLISGIRAMDRRVIEGVPSKYMKGYMVECALNYACRVRGYRYGTVAMSGIKIRHKYDKVWFGRAVLQYVKMSWQVVKAIVLVRVARINGKF